VLTIVNNETTFRAAAVLVLLPLVSVAAYHRIRAARASPAEKLDRRQEGLARAIALRLCGLAMWAGMFTYLISPETMRWSQVDLPGWLRWAGAGLGALSVPLLWWQMQALGRNLTDTVVTRANATLVTSGPYRWVRHPLYMIALIFVASFSLLAANWFVLASWVGAMAFLRARTRIEEQKLVERFGDEYRAYMRRTGRYFPRLRR